MTLLRLVAAILTLAAMSRSASALIYVHYYTVSPSCSHVAVGTIDIDQDVGANRRVAGV